MFQAERLTDTTPDAKAVQIELLRRMSVAQRCALALSMTDAARRAARSAIAAMRPELDDRQQRLKLIEICYGSPLAQAVADYLKSVSPDVAT